MVLMPEGFTKISSPKNPFKPGPKPKPDPTGPQLRAWFGPRIFLSPSLDRPDPHNTTSNSKDTRKFHTRPRKIQS
jgi:hypothetical protein